MAVASAEEIAALMSATPADPAQLDSQSIREADRQPAKNWLAEARQAALQDFKTAAPPLSVTDLSPAAVSNLVPPPVPNQPASVAATSTEEPLPLAEPAPVEPASVADEFVDIVYKGKPVQLSKGQVLEFAQKGFDYTQKTQMLADFKRDADEKLSKLSEERELVINFLKDPKQVIAYAEHLRSQLGTAPNVSPDDIPTHADLQQAIRAQVENAKKEISQEIAAARQAVEDQQEEARYRNEFTTHVTSLASKFPQLDVYDPADLERSLRADVGEAIQLRLKVNPYDELSAENVKALFTDAARRRADRIDTKRGMDAKMAVVRAAKGHTPAPAVHASAVIAIEPPGGHAPNPAPAPVEMKLGGSALRDVVLADMRAAEAALRNR